MSGPVGETSAGHKQQLAEQKGDIRHAICRSTSTSKPAGEHEVQRVPGVSGLLIAGHSDLSREDDLPLGGTPAYIPANPGGESLSLLYCKIV